MSYRENWEEVELGEICKSISIKHKFNKEKLIFLNTSDIDKGKFLHSEYRDIDGLPGQAKKSIQLYDILFSEIRPKNGRYAFVNFNSEDYVVSTKLMVIRANKKTTPQYLYTLLTSPQMLGWFQLLAEGRSGTFPQITFEQVRTTKVKLPPLSTQKRIASIISAFDEKIELNRQMNATLEAMAQAMFREMCLPDDEEELEEGWKWRKIGDLVDTISDTYKFKNIDEIIFLNTGDVLKGFVQHHNYRPTKGLPGQAKKRIKKGDILYSEIRPKNKRYAYVDFDAEDYVVSTKLMVLRSKEIIDTMYIYFYLTQNDVIAKLQQLAESRSGTFPQITFTQLKNVDIPIPPKKILNKFLGFLKPAYEKIYQNHQENLELAKSRDLLLPKLMSGEIEV